MNKNNKKDPARCSFCGRHKINLDYLVASPDERNAICDDCIAAARAAVAASGDEKVVELFPNTAA